MWSQFPVMLLQTYIGISHWGRKQQQFYGFAANRESAFEEVTPKRIIIACHKALNSPKAYLQASGLGSLIFQEKMMTSYILNSKIGAISKGYTSKTLKTMLSSFLFQAKLTNHYFEDGLDFNYDESNTYVLERFNTTAGNPVKKILLKLNLSDHRKLKDGGEVKEFQRSFRHSDTERLSRSDEVLKLKNFKKDATLKLFKSTNQERKSSQSLCLVQDLTSRELEAEKVHQEKVQQEKLKEVKGRLNFEGCSRRNPRVQEVPQYSESGTPNVRGEHQRGRRSGRSHSMFESPEWTSVFSRIRRDRSESPKHRPGGKERRGGGVFNRLDIREKVCLHIQKAVTRVTTQKKWNPSLENVTMKDHIHGGQKYSLKVKIAAGDIGRKNQRSIGQASRMATYHNHGYAAAKVECWPMPTWCHMFNSTLTGSARVWFDDLPPESIDNYDDLKKAFLANFLQQKKCIKFKAESRHVKGAPECMRISRFMHEMTNPELIKRLHDNIPKSVDQMMRITVTFLRGEVAASNQPQKKDFRHRNSRNLGESRILIERETSGASKGLSEGVTSSPSSQSPQGKFYPWIKANLRLHRQ
ncbi:reverse transcriptase domain-containing protein [Tanacetum coccineum]